MHDRRSELGAAGEARAALWLEQRGYRIVARNVRAGGVELDIVARKGPVIAFVEVKTRTSTRQGSPVLAVDARKQARIVRGASAWLRAHPHVRRTRARFDVIACLRTGPGPDDWRIEHWAAAFDASAR
jgi:putative endonuclease